VRACWPRRTAWTIPATFLPRAAAAIIVLLGVVVLIVLITRRRQQRRAGLHREEKLQSGRCRGMLSLLAVLTKLLVVELELKVYACWLHVCCAAHGSLPAEPSLADETAEVQQGDACEERHESDFSTRTTSLRLLESRKDSLVSRLVALRVEISVGQIDRQLNPKRATPPIHERSEDTQVRSRPRPWGEGEPPPTSPSAAGSSVRLEAASGRPSLVSGEM